MKSIQAIDERHTHELARDKEGVISQVIELSAVTYPLLMAHLLYLRQLNGMQTRTDSINQNAQLRDEFLRLCENNLFFFLTVTGQFALIREIFQDKAELGRLIALVQEMQKEYEQALVNQRDQLLVPKIPPVAPTPTASSPTALNDDYYGLNAMHLYQQQEFELRIFTYKHHVKQAKLYSHAANDSLRDLEHIIKKVEEDSTIPSDVKHACLKDLEGCRHKILAKQTAWEEANQEFETSNPHDVLKAEKLHKVGKDYFEEVVKMGDVLKKYKNITPEVHEIFERHEKRVHKTQATAQKNEEVFEMGKAKREANLKKTKEHIVASIDGRLDKLADMMSTLRLHHLDDEAKQTKVLNAMSRLATYREQLKTEENSEAIQSLLSKCNQELVLIKEIIAPIAPPKFMQDFNREHQALRKMMFVQAPEFEVGPENEVAQKKEVVHENTSKKVEPITETSIPKQESQDKEVISQSLKAEHQEEIVEAHELNQPQIELHEDDLVQVEPQDTSEIFKSFKEAISSERPGVQSVPEEHQSQYQEIVEKMQERLEKIKLMMGTDSPNLQIERMELLLENSKSLGFDRAQESTLEEIYSLTKELGAEDEDFLVDLDELTSIFDFPGENLQIS
jgi:hypothetical protein